MLPITIISMLLVFVSAGYNLFQWKKISGPGRRNSYGTGYLESYDSSNHPGSREGCVTWIDNSIGYIFGGHGYAKNTGPGYLNDLWSLDANNRFKAHEGTSFSGINENGISDYRRTTGRPGGRVDMSVARNYCLNFCQNIIIGGYGYGTSGTSPGYLADFWSYSASSDQFSLSTYFNSEINPPPLSYSTSEEDCDENRFGGRRGHFSIVIDAVAYKSQIIIGHGFGIDYVGNYGYLNEIWVVESDGYRYDEKFKCAFKAGSMTRSQVGVYNDNGCKANNVIGARAYSVVWKKSSTQIYVWGGNGYAEKDLGTLNDLWSFDTTTYVFCYINGKDEEDERGKYSDIREFDDENYPRSLQKSAGFVHTGYNDFVLFSGMYRGYALYDEIWRLDINSQEWSFERGGGANPPPYIASDAENEYDVFNTPGGIENGIFMSFSDSRTFFIFGNGQDLLHNDDGLLCDLWQLESIYVHTCFGIEYYNSDVCSGHGICRNDNDCLCDDGYEGSECSQFRCYSHLSTSPSVCSGFGTCFSPDSCFCSPNYYGDECDNWYCNGISRKEPGVCNAHGDCESPNICNCSGVFLGSFCDNCAEYTTGPSCEHNVCNHIVDYDPNVCSGHGNCQYPNYCNCSLDYTGTNCEIWNCWIDSTCNNHGVCISHNNCSCHPGYFGPQCDNWTCSGTPNTNPTTCSNHGDCIDHDFCNCTADYFGPNCNKWLCFGIPHDDGPCSNKGTCTAPETCICDNNGEYYGTDCSDWNCFGTHKDDPMVCGELRGSCVDYNDCDCGAYMGLECTAWGCLGVPYDSSDVCNERGMCIDVDKCLCDEFWYGLNCEEYINDVFLSKKQPKHEIRIEYNVPFKYIESSVGTTFEATSIIDHEDVYLFGANSTCSWVIESGVVVMLVCTLGDDYSISVGTFFQVYLQTVNFKALLQVSAALQNTRDVLPLILVPSIVAPIVLLCLVFVLIIVIIVFVVLTKQKRNRKLALADNELSNVNVVVAHSELDNDTDDDKLCEIDADEITEIVKQEIAPRIYPGKWKDMNVMIKLTEKSSIDKSAFMKELDLVFSLKHPSLPTVFGYFEDTQFYGYVLENCNGGCLYDLIESGDSKAVSVEEKYRLLMEVAGICEFVHMNDLIVGNLCLRNCMLTQSKVIKLVNFAEANPNTDIHNNIYVAPEGNVSDKVDQFAFSCVLYQLLSDRIVENDDIPIDFTLPNDIDSDIAEIFFRCQDHNPTRRVQFSVIKKVLLDKTSTQKKRRQDGKLRDILRQVKEFNHVPMDDMDLPSVQVCGKSYRASLKNLRKFNDGNIITMYQLKKMKDRDIQFMLPAGISLIKYKNLRLDRVIGKGATSTVYLGVYKKKRVAFKLYQIDYNERIMKKLFERELNLYLKMKISPFVLQLKGICLKKNHIGLLTEWCPFGDLKTFLEDTPEYEYEGRKSFTYQISKGMEVVHKYNIIHRDLKPANILLDTSLKCKIIDFGLSRSCGKMSVTKTRRIGTPIYMAPEVYKSGKYDLSSDVFSYAILAYVCVTGNFFPYGMKLMLQNVEKMISEDPNLRPDLSIVEDDWLRELLAMMWDDKRRMRPTFSDIVAVFEEHME